MLRDQGACVGANHHVCAVSRVLIGRMENLSLSVPDLLTTVKQFVDPAKHEQLDAMLQRYMQKELGKQQARCCGG